MLTTPARGTRDISRVMAEFIVGLKAGEIPSDAVAVAERGTVDYFTVAIAGSIEPGMTALVKYVDRIYAGGVDLLLTGAKKAAEAAAMV